MTATQTQQTQHDTNAPRPVKKDNWRLIAWNGKKRAGYVVLAPDGAPGFTQNWRDATVFPTKEAWDEARAAIHALGASWTSTPLNAPRKIKEASS